MRLVQTLLTITAAALSMTALSVVALPRVARAYHMEDTLRGGTTGNASGGTFGPDGWTVTAKTDRIWWAIPRLASGSIEFTVRDVTMSNLVVNDNEIFAMYEAGHEIEEPIRYSPEFRNNYWKALLRIYGTAEPGREGAMKLMWGMCPSGAPGYWTDADTTCGCESFFEEPFAASPAWDGSPQQIRIEWGGGVTRLLREGVEIVSIEWADSGIEFGPSEVHFMLGSPRNDAVDTASMPIGAIFSDVVVDGVEGAQSICDPVDGGIELDAGTTDTDASADGDASAPELDAASDGGFDAGRDDAGRRTSVVDSGCGCRAAGARSRSSAGLLALVALGALWARRRASC